MISTTDYLRERAIDILTERAERRVVGLAEIVPNVTMTTFGGEKISIKELVSEKPLLLTFMRASW